MASTDNTVTPITGADTKVASSQLQPETHRPRAKTLAITSGKGGVGKSNVATNLAITLAQKGHKVCIFDADTNLANVNILMGLNPHYTIEHLLNGAKTLNEIMVTGPAGLKIIPAASGIADDTEYNPDQKKRLINALESLEQQFDYIIVDTAAGIGKNVTRFLRSVQNILLIISTEPTSLTDAFALLRVLKRGGYNKTIHVLVNMAINFGNGMEVFKRFSGAVDKYLQIPLNFIGYITDDISVRDSVRYQCPVVLYRPDSLASRCFSNIEKGLGAHIVHNDQSNSFSSFWKELLNRDDIDTDSDNNQPEFSANVSVADDEVKQRALNFLASIELSNEDKISILLAQIDGLSETMTGMKSINPNLQSQLFAAIDKLQRYTNAGNNPENKFLTMAENLTNAGSKLEQQITELNLILEDLAETPLQR